MATQTRNAVIGVFREREAAREAVHALRAARFADDQIGVASSDGDRMKTSTGNYADQESYAEEGALTGVAAGAGVGALWGMGILAGILPAIGPAIAGGTLAALLSSAAAGAAAAGVTGALIGMGIPKEEAEFYESELKSGRTIVTVNADGRRNEAQAILQRFGGYDISSRSSDDSVTTPPTYTRSPSNSPDSTWDAE